MIKLLQKGIWSLILLPGLMLAGCGSSLVIENVDYAQSIESVLTPNEQGVVNDVEHGIEFSILPLQFEETQDTSSVTVEQVRYIRGQEGYYYITASGFQNVYIMTPEEGQLVLNEQVLASEQGIASPALNQRGSFIQLVDRESGETWRLSSDGIQEEESQTTNSNGDQL